MITEIINNLIIDRENTLSVKSIKVNKIKGSMGNPMIMVGTLPFYEWSEDKRITYVICYGRYLNCEMLCYKTYKKDKSFFETNNQEEAVNKVKSILKSI